MYTIADIEVLMNLYLKSWLSIFRLGLGKYIGTGSLEGVMFAVKCCVMRVTGRPTRSCK